MRTTLAIILLALLGAGDLVAQSGYRGAIGLRAGNFLAVSGRWMPTARFGVEGLAGYRNSGFQAVLLGQYDRPLGPRSDFHGYAGGGLHAGRYELSVTGEHTATLETAFGLDAQLGVEFVSPSVPLTIAADWKPRYELLGERTLEPLVAGFTVRWAMR